MVTRWLYNERPEEEQVAKLAEEIGVSTTIAYLLSEKGLDTAEKVDAFFNPDLENLHNPFLMKDMDKAIERIGKAMDRDEKILIYGDYDVDGTTAVALVYGFFKHFHGPVNYYIPDRYKEGYGLSKEGIDYAASNGYGLMITLDCGIKAVEMTKYAHSKGIDIVICDHHRPGDILPSAYAILDPKQSDCEYPYKELSGCGVGFKLLQAFCHHKHYDPDLLYDYLDLVVVSIASDIVPITGENRILAYHGLKKLNNHPRPGFEALIKSADIRNEIDISSIVFGIGPRINASGRMDHANNAVDLLCTDNIFEATNLAETLDDKNSERRNFDMSITSEAINMIDESQVLRDAKSTVLFKQGWHKGVIGIVASRCLERYYRPTVILTESNGKASGSARSVTGFDVYEAISQCSDLLEQFGGHMYAAGLTMELEKVEAFKERFEKVVAAKITADQLVPQINIDLEIDLEDINQELYETLSKMAPFGPGNMQPLFATSDLHISGIARVLKEQHLKFYVKQDGSEKTFDVIGFGFGKYSDLVASGMRFKMTYYVEENNFMGNKNLQLRVKDIKFD